MLWLTERVVRGLESATRHLPFRLRKHLLLGKRGEMEAYFHLRHLGYRIIAANYRLPFDRGEIDFIGWDGATLCFVEVKTRSSVGFAPPETAVDRAKRRHILSVARRYLRRMRDANRPRCRFDVVSVVMDLAAEKPEITLHRDAFTWPQQTRRERWPRDYVDRRSWRGR